MTRAPGTCNTMGTASTMTAITEALGLTLPGATMRSRHSAAMMRAMGLDELVVADTDAYVDLAVTLGLDRDRREALRARVRERKHLLYDDQCAIEAFSRFLREPSSLAAR